MREGLYGVRARRDGGNERWWLRCVAHACRLTLVCIEARVRARGGPIGVRRANADEIMGESDMAPFDWFTYAFMHFQRPRSSKIKVA
jgi:hypothetical protein